MNQVTSRAQAKELDVSQVTTRAQAKELELDSRADLDSRAAAGETVVPGGTGGKSVEAQERLAEGRKAGGEARKEQLTSEGYSEMGKKGGLASVCANPNEAAKVRGVDIDEPKFTS